MSNAQLAKIQHQEYAKAHIAEVAERIAKHKLNVTGRAKQGKHCIPSCKVRRVVLDSEWVGCSACGVYVHNQCVTNVQPRSSSRSSRVENCTTVSNARTSTHKSVESHRYLLNMITAVVIIVTVTSAVHRTAIDERSAQHIDNTILDQIVGGDTLEERVSESDYTIFVRVRRETNS